MTETTHADRIVAEADEALTAIYAKIADKRAQRKALNDEIAELREQARPLSRIVTAARGRQPKEANGDAGGSE